MIARHVVLATGRDGLGGPYVPPFANGIDRKFWAHTADEIDFAALNGKRIGVVGAGASGMDNAATALEPEPPVSTCSCAGRTCHGLTSSPASAARE